MGETEFYISLSCLCRLGPGSFIIRDDHLILNNQSVGSALGEAISPTISIPFLYIVIFLDLKPHGISTFHISLSIGIALFKICLAVMLVGLCL